MNQTCKILPIFLLLIAGCDESLASRGLQVDELKRGLFCNSSCNYPNTAARPYLNVDCDDTLGADEIECVDAGLEATPNSTRERLNCQVQAETAALNCANKLNECNAGAVQLCFQDQGIDYNTSSDGWSENCGQPVDLTNSSAFRQAATECRARQVINECRESGGSVEECTGGGTGGGTGQDNPGTRAPSDSSEPVEN